MKMPNEAVEPYAAGAARFTADVEANRFAE
jgi:hypothetical protein